MTLYKDIIKPTIVLTAISLVVSVSLAFTFNATEPVIKQSEKNAADLARAEVLKEADSFEKIENDKMPEGLIDAYKATNGAGYVFTTQNKGFGGPMKVMVGIKSDGKISAAKVIESNETPGLGTKVAEPEHISQYAGKDTKLSNIDAITGVTISSGALKGAVKIAFEAYNSIVGVTDNNSIDNVSVPGFTKIEFTSSLEGLLSAYKDDEGRGYLFLTVAKGYGGNMVVGTLIDKNGTLVNLGVLNHSETVGEAVTKDEYLSKFIGKNGKVDDVAAITGATISSTALKTAVNTSFAAYQIVKGA